MDKCDDLGTDENVLNFNVSDDALESAGAPESPAITFDFCTYNYLQCGPIGGRG